MKKKNKTPQRLTTCGAIQDSDEYRSKTSSAARSLYDTVQPCQETTPDKKSDGRAISVRIFVKGICTPTNPGGFACWGWMALNGQVHVIARECGCIGQGVGMSSAVAEYQAVIHALTWVDDRKARVELFTDSHVLFNQVSGKWLCSAPHLLPLCEHVIQLMDNTHAHLQLIAAHLNGSALGLCHQAYTKAAREGAR